MKTLLVEDDFTCRCWLRGLVKKLGFTVVAEAPNGEQAVAAVTRAKPDLVLLDVSMPLLTGPQALPAILAAHPGVKVVMLTSIADQGTVVECIEKGAVGYLRKDSSVEEISRLLTGLRNQAAAPQEQGAAHAGN
jgi:DNA-binding NarL/FixJ family response regulator